MGIGAGPGDRKALKDKEMGDCGAGQELGGDAGCPEGCRKDQKPVQIFIPSDGLLVRAMRAATQS